MNTAKAGVQAVGKSDVDDAVDAAKRHGRFGSVSRQRIEALSRASGEQYSEGVFHGGTIERPRWRPIRRREASPTQRRILAQPNASRADGGPFHERKKERPMTGRFVSNPGG